MPIISAIGKVVLEDCYGFEASPNSGSVPTWVLKETLSQEKRKEKEITDSEWVEYLPSIYGALGSVPSTVRKK